MIMEECGIFGVRPGLVNENRLPKILSTRLIISSHFFDGRLE